MPETGYSWYNAGEGFNNWDELRAAGWEYTQGEPYLFVPKEVFDNHGRHPEIGEVFRLRNTNDGTETFFKLRRYNEDRGGWELSWAD